MKHDTYSGWGRVLKATGDMARPERASAPRPAGPGLGNLRAYGDAALNSDGPAVNMTRMDRFLAFDAETGHLRAEAGVTISEILHVFGPKGWYPAVMPGTAYATLGGAIAADVHGKNHERAGSFGAHVAEIELRGADGMVRKVAEGSDLFRATLGGMGLTGLIEAATIRLAPCPSAQMEVSEARMPDLKAFLEAFDRCTSPFSVGWIDAMAADEALGRGVFEEADFAPAGADFPKARPSARSVPIEAPGFVLSSPIVRAMNAMFYRRVPGEGRRRKLALSRFFFPLDNVTNWNKLYGKRGFHQFQCVVPLGDAEPVLRALLEDISAAGLASPLAVLKRLGAGRAGHLSFPMEGYTLAVDLPNKGGAEALVGRLMAQTKDAGGRIYLAKDSLAKAGDMAAMYPELEAFRAVLREADPGGVFETDLARRLDLREGV